MFRERRKASLKPNRETNPANTMMPHLTPQSTVYYEERGARISDVSIRDPRGNRINILDRYELYFLEFKVAFLEPCLRVRFSMLIKTINGLELAAQWSSPVGMELEGAPAGQQSKVEFPVRLPFTAGTYFANVGVVGTVAEKENMTLHRVVDAIMFRISPAGRIGAIGTPISRTLEGLLFSRSIGPPYKPVPV